MYRRAVSRNPALATVQWRKMPQSNQQFLGNAFVGPLSRWRQAHRRPRARDRHTHTHHPSIGGAMLPAGPVSCPRPPLSARNRRSVSRVLNLWRTHLDKTSPVPIASILANRFRVSPLFDGLPLRNPISIDTRQANGRPGCNLLSREPFRQMRASQLATPPQGPSHHQPNGEPVSPLRAGPRSPDTPFWCGVDGGAAFSSWG